MAFLSNLWKPAPVPATPVATAAKTDRFTPCVNFVLLREGGFSNHPLDPGCATNMGITLRALSVWRGKPCTVNDIMALKVDEAKAIYRANYWNTVQGDKLPPGVDLAVFDASVNSGPAQAAKWLQKAVGAAQDGSIGPATLAALATKDPVVVAQAVCRTRLAFLKSLPTWITFGKGWGRRVAEVEAQFLG